MKLSFDVIEVVAEDISDFPDLCGFITSYYLFYNKSLTDFDKSIHKLELVLHNLINDNIRARFLINSKDKEPLAMIVYAVKGNVIYIHDLYWVAQLTDENSTILNHFLQDTIKTISFFIKDPIWVIDAPKTNYKALLQLNVFSKVKSLSNRKMRLSTQEVKSFNCRLKPIPKNSKIDLLDRNIIKREYNKLHSQYSKQTNSFKSETAIEQEKNRIYH